MTSNQLTNAAAIAFAGFAAWFLLRGKSSSPVVMRASYPTYGGSVVQAGQVQRDFGLQSWMTDVQKQWAELNPQLPQASYDETERLLKRYPAPAGS